MQRNLLTLVGIAAVISCGGDSRSPTNPTPPPPTVTFTLSGAVTESVPTTSITIAGASVRIVDGQDAGRTATTTSTGSFELTGLRSLGGYTIEASAPGYMTGSQGAVGSNTLTIRLKPTFQLITSTRNETISGGDPACLTSSTDPCRVFAIDAHHNGFVESTLTWTDRDTWLWLELYRASDGSQVVRSSASRVDGLRQQISTGIVEGQRYLLVVRFVFGARVTSFSLTTSRPN